MPPASDSLEPVEMQVKPKPQTRWDRLSEKLNLWHLVGGCLFTLVVGSFGAGVYFVEFKTKIGSAAAHDLKEHASGDHTASTAADAVQDSRLLVLEALRLEEEKHRAELRQDVRAIMRHFRVPPPEPLP